MVAAAIPPPEAGTSPDVAIWPHMLSEAGVLKQLPTEALQRPRGLGRPTYPCPASTGIARKT